MKAQTAHVLVMASAAAVGAWLLARAWSRRAAPVTPAPPRPPVRDAGPTSMADPPREWDMVDQQADESFPASDPPGNY